MTLNGQYLNIMMDGFIHLILDSITTKPISVGKGHINRC